MSAILIMLVSFAILFTAYLTYGAWLSRKWGIDPRRITPAHKKADGKDYVPARTPVLLGHHFASIAGASTITGPIQAAVFGWVPVLLWILVGGIFFGAVQDFGALFASVRHEGKSVGDVVERHIGRRAKGMFLLFAWITLLLVVSAFADIVANTFATNALADIPAAANGTTASTSILFIIVSVAFGFFVYSRHTNLLVATVAGLTAIALCIVVGIHFPLYFSKNFWLAAIFIYIFVASITPVWLLLRPRDYLNSFLLYALILSSFLGILFTNPTIQLAPFTGLQSSIGPLFPMLFITVACGAISGFHSLVGSGTTSKQLDREEDARLIGYGGMLIECGLAVVALIAVGVVATDTSVLEGTPTNIFSWAVAGFVESFGIPFHVAYTIISLSISAFALTTLDTATRLGRYMFQELFAPQEGESPNGFYYWAANPYFATAVTIVLAALLSVVGYEGIWSLFGSANQLLATLTLLAVAAWMGGEGKDNRMFYIPVVFMLWATLTAQVITIRDCIYRFISPETGGNLAAGVQLAFAFLLLGLAMMLTAEYVYLVRVAWRKRRRNRGK